MTLSPAQKDMLARHEYVKPTDYMGEHFPDYYEVYGAHRDSDRVTRSNFQALEAILDDLGADYRITRASHWAVGWVDTIRVPLGAPEPVLAAVADALIYLEDSYPLLDEDLYCQLEFDEALEYWDSLSLNSRVNACRETGCSVFAARRNHDLPDELWAYLTAE